MPKISQTCRDGMTKAKRDFVAWQINWVVGREYYRAHQDAFSLAYWDGIAWGNYGKPDFTDDQPALSDYRQQVKSGFEANTPGWNNSACSLDLPSLACFAFWMAATSDAVRQTAVTLMMQHDADIPYIKESCPPEVTSDPSYQIEVPPVPGPGGETVPPTPINPVPPGLETLPPGTKTPGGTDVVDPNTPGGIIPVKADDTGAGKKTNWWLWGSIAAAVVGGAAFIGFARDPVYEETAAPNPGPAGSPYGPPYKIEIKLYSRQIWEHFAANLSSIKKVNGVLKNMRASAKRDSEMYAYPKNLASELRAVADGLAEVRVLDRLNNEIWHAEQVPMGASKANKNPFGKPGPNRITWPTLGSVTVHQLGTNNEFEYQGITPEAAVIAAYAQSLGDNNTWDYKKKYSHLLKRRGRTINIGDFAAVG